MIYDKVVSYCEENNISICAFEKKCGIANGTIGRWRKEKSKPNIETLQKIVNSTHTKLAEWIEE